MKKQIIFIFFIFQITFLYAQKPLDWYSVDFPPFFMREQGEIGSVDYLVEYFQKKMPKYKHQYLKSNLSRFMSLSKNKVPYINPFLLKTKEREEFLYFSYPIGVMIPNELIIKKGNLKKFKFKKSISLKKILEDNNLKGVITKNRSYGSNLDKIINETKNNNLLKRTSNNDKNNMLMLLTGRIDYTINYFISSKYLTEKSNIKEEITSIIIKEDPEIKLVYFACTKTPFGKELIDSVNNIIITERNTEEFKEIIKEAWHYKSTFKILEKEYNTLNSLEIK